MLLRVFVLAYFQTYAAMLELMNISVSSFCVIFNELMFLISLTDCNVSLHFVDIISRKTILKDTKYKI